MQHHLHHRELVEVGVEQRRDDHAGPVHACREGSRSAESRNVTRLRRPAKRSSHGLVGRAAAVPVDDADPPREPQADERAADRQPADRAEVRQRAVGARGR